ncbi:MAG: iron-containing alcohol dehydrogenase [Patescibacteria group bacterium]
MIKGYYLPSKIYFASGIISNLSEILDCPGKPIGLFIDTYILESGLLQKIKDFLSASDIRFISEVKSIPSIIQVERATAMARDSRVALVVAIGGGSALDLAKSAAVLSQNPGALIDFLQKKKIFINKGIPCAAVPTTAGTGSEVTPYAAIWGEDKTKYSLNSFLLFPAWAICDPELTLSLPSLATASTGIDALCQAIEAYWSIYSFPLSDIHAVKAISLILESLEKAVQEPGNLLHREKMMLAALEAGRAFSQTATTAVHSVSYPMTAYFGIPHGYACGLTLSSFLKYNFEVTEQDCNDLRGFKFAQSRILEIVDCLGCQTVDEACLKIKNLMRSIGLEVSLAGAGITDIEVIVEHGFTPDRVANNPRLVTRENLRKLLENIG